MSESVTITITRAVMTCTAYPSQWDAWTEDGRELYLRYRYGCGTAQLDGPAGETVASFETGHSYDGHIDLAEFCERAGLKLATGVVDA